MTQTALILLTYPDLPSFGPGGYARFLAEEDNPFFNSIPGIARYENWRVTERLGQLPAPGFDWFDLMWLDSPEVLEQVWFDKALTAFRRGWVARWGYGGLPSGVNAAGHLYLGTRAGPPPLAARLVLAGGDNRLGAPPGAVGLARDSQLPKHYAWPEGAAPQPWRQPAGAAGATGPARLWIGDPPLPAALPSGATFAVAATRVAPA
jgi:hypothetical protein